VEDRAGANKTSSVNHLDGVTDKREKHADDHGIPENLAFKVDRGGQIT
jgi:hypothetical protein